MRRNTLDLSVRTQALPHFSVTVANRCDFHSFSRWQTETADEGRAACSSTTLVIAWQGTKRRDRESVQQLQQKKTIRYG